jgi:methionyl aminopeptidase
MTASSPEEIEALRRIGRIVADCLRAMAAALRPGLSTRELDAVGAAFLRQHGARSAPQLTYDFPGATCISINEEAAHGIPGDRIVQPGDLVNIDVSAELDGFFSDTGGSFGVPPVSKLAQRLLAATAEARAAGIDAARAGGSVQGIGRAIEATATRWGFTILRNLGSHGVGRALHEEPRFIAGFADPSDHRHLREGMVITIEPFLSNGARFAEEASDGWTLLSQPRRLSAQCEHTILVTKTEPLVLTL